jgi:hypothetical protein
MDSFAPTAEGRKACPDRELAAAVQQHLVEQFAKKPPPIGFIKNGTLDTDGGTFNFSPKFLDDARTFKLKGL